MNTTRKTKINMVEAYLAGKKSLREKAKENGISYITLWRWVKRYRFFKKKKNKQELFRHWRQLPEEIERKIVLLKENHPRLTIMQTRRKLLAENISTSAKAIWAVWHRYGFGQITDPEEVHNVLLPLRQEVELLPELKEAADLNSLDPSNNISMKDYNTRVHAIRLQMEKNGFMYASLRLGVRENFSSHWLGRPKRILRLCHHLLKHTPRDACTIGFLIHRSAAYAGSNLQQYGVVNKHLARCAKMEKKLAFPFFQRELAQMYLMVGKCRKARQIYEALVKGSLPKVEYPITKSNFANLLFMSGDYAKSLETFTSCTSLWSWPTGRKINQAIVSACHLASGDLVAAKQIAQTLLVDAQQEENSNVIYNVMMVLAGCRTLSGDIIGGQKILRQLKILLSRNKLKRWQTTVNTILAKKSINGNVKSPRMDPQLKILQFMLISRQKSSPAHLQRAHQYARSAGLLGVYHRFCTLMPDVVINALSKGKQTGLPRAILDYPVFSSSTPIIHVNYLGRVKIFKHNNEKTISVKNKKSLAPKDMAFLIFLSSCKRNHIPINEIGGYFWPKSNAVGLNLSHLLVRLKRALGIAPHLMYVRNGSLVINCPFITDWEQYQESITQAKFFEKIGQQSMAIKEYRSAFALYRGEPFEKMYDGYSIDKRREILNKMEDHASIYKQKYIGVSDKISLNQINKKFMDRFFNRNDAEIAEAGG